MKRLVSLLNSCWESDDACVLVGATGSGKTAAIQYIAQIKSLEKHNDLNSKSLIIVNCQQNTDVSDLIGFYQPTILTTAEIDNFRTLAQIVIHKWEEMELPKEKASS